MRKDDGFKVVLLNSNRASLLTDPYIADALGIASSTMLTDEHLRLQLGQAARVRSRSFSWDRHASELVEAIESVIGSPSRR